MHCSPAAAFLIRILTALAAVIAGSLANAAAAHPYGRVATDCLIVTDEDRPPATPCSRHPDGYHGRWLWLELPTPVDAAPWRITLRQSRFDQAVAVFRYADGAERRLVARSGDFGDHWRVGGKLAFDPPARGVPVVKAHLGFENLAAHRLLRVRVTPVAVADRAEEVATLITGGALALIAFTILYNLGIGLGARRRFALWHAAWAACVCGWGLLWTQVALFVWPAIAGAPAVGLSILLSSAAIACSACFFVASLEPGVLPRWTRFSLHGAAAAMALLGVAGGFGPREWMTVMGQLYHVTVLAAAASLAVAVAHALHARSRSARDFALSWVATILMVVWTVLTDTGLTADDDGGQLLVLLVCALQTVGLSLVIGQRLSSVRRERIEAQAREAQLKTLADTDPLTGLYNRRGFVSRVEAAFGDVRPVALILLDLDHFKAVNDSFGHDAGDRVLFSVAAALRALSGDAVVGRLGGEEFGVAVTGVTGPALVRVAERLRRGIAGLELGGGPSRITASFGVAEDAGSSFEALYRAADRALYRAKAQGRNRVALAEGYRTEARMSLAG